MATGEIKFFKEDKGFGFIKGDDGKDYFVHINKVAKGAIPKSGDKVTFKVVPGKKGPEAVDVVIGGGSTATAPSPQHASFAGEQSSTPVSASFAYGFVKRKAGKATPVAFHHRQEADRLDVAFDIAWTTETPTALQPCEDVGVNESAVNRKGENIGYNKRWLMIDGKPAISPFTVKGAIASGVANLLGGCYRVPDREEGHNRSLNAGTYPYTGKWKRYRVSMNAKSLPGIIREIDLDTGYVKVQPVTEYYWDQPNLPLEIVAGGTCHAAWTVDRRRNIIGRLAQQGAAGRNQGPVTYYGPYRFGMDLRLLPGDMGKRHYHRFYSIQGGELDGHIPLLSLAPEKKLLDKVYGGQYCKGEERELKVQRMRDHLGKPWYENLRELQPGDWCYYTVFNDENCPPKIAAIGKNFQFKALFNHQQALPSGNATCTDLKKLCPRCALFGLADKGEGKDKEAVGYAGRFKSATLISDVEAVAAPKTVTTIPRVEKVGSQFNTSTLPLELLSFASGEKIILRQFPLPIMGPPKPSKRDVDGYFNEQTGAIKGAKRYHHANLDFDKDLPNLIAYTDKKIDTEEGMPYAHQMRPVATVCREGISFTGTVGAENCSVEEIAALLALLDRRAADHAFKLGLGKNIGLGSVSSRINKVWVRQPGKSWESVSVPHEENSRKELFAAVKGLLPEALEALKSLINNPEAAAKLHSIKDKKERLDFRKAGLGYWKEAKVETV